LRVDAEGIRLTSTPINRRLRVRVLISLVLYIAGVVLIVYSNRNAVLLLNGGVLLAVGTLMALNVKEGNYRD